MISLKACRNADDFVCKSIWLVQSMYANVRSRVRVGDGYSDEFSVLVGVHQGSVLSPLLFIILLEALSRQFRTGCPWELLYADDQVIMAESMHRLLEQVEVWKEGMEEKGLRVNMGKNQVHDLGVAAGQTAEDWQIPLCRLSHRHWQ